jgi:hypothetical protein
MHASMVRWHMTSVLNRSYPDKDQTEKSRITRLFFFNDSLRNNVDGELATGFSTATV